MKQPVIHDIARLRRLVAEAEERTPAPFALYERWCLQEAADIRELPDGTFRISMAGVRVQTTAGRINALLMWLGKARDIIAAAEGGGC